jgi:hypothetical protein
MRGLARRTCLSMPPSRTIPRATVATYQRLALPSAYLVIVDPSAHPQTDPGCSLERAFGNRFDDGVQLCLCCL